MAGWILPDVWEAVAEHPTVGSQVVVQDDPTQAVLQMLKVEVSHSLLESSSPSLPPNPPAPPKIPPISGGQNKQGPWQKRRQGEPQPVIHVGLGSPRAQVVVCVLSFGSCEVVVQG